jgi:hypothetical protein
VGERERVRRKSTKEKTKPEEVAETKEGQVSEQSTVEPAQVIITEDVKEYTTTEVVATTEVVEEPPLLPSWGDVNQTEWMYHIPVREEDLEMWASEWADFTLAWCEENVIHILSFSLFVSEIPFKDIQNKADAYRKIGDKLIEKEVGRWMEGKKRQLRVYWRFLEEWADLIYQWALDNGKIRMDVKSIIIQESKQSFSNLPEKELHFIMKLLVERNQADWIDIKKGAIRLIT